MFLNDVSPLILYDVERVMAMEPMQGKGASSRFDLRYTKLFCIPEVTSVFFCVVTVFLGTLRISVKQNVSPFLFLREHRIALHAKQGNRASSLGEGELSWVFSSCGRNLGYILELRWGGHSKLEFVQRSQDSCLLMMDTSGI